MWWAFHSVVAVSQYGGCFTVWGVNNVKFGRFQLMVASFHSMVHSVDYHRFTVWSHCESPVIHTVNHSMVHSVAPNLTLWSTLYFTL